MGLRNILSNPTAYHHVRNMITGGLPFRQWVELYGLTNANERVADLGCGPCDILRYVAPDKRPAFYLGIDISEDYLGAARQRAAAANLDAEFLAMDLARIPSDADMRRKLVDLLEKHRITRVLLLGVIHHIDDASALTTINLVHQAATVQSLVTQDVIRMPGMWINNRFCSLDRGEHIRTESEYDALAAKSDWPHHRKFWTSPALRFLRYIHYDFRKGK